MAIRSTDLAAAPGSPRAVERHRRLTEQQLQTLGESFRTKRWSELTPPERDILLRILATQFGLIAPG